LQNNSDLDAILPSVTNFSGSETTATIQTSRAPLGGLHPTSTSNDAPTDSSNFPKNPANTAESLSFEVKEKLLLENDQSSKLLTKTPPPLTISKVDNAPILEELLKINNVSGWSLLTPCSEALFYI
jgi:hypothetical protein